MKFFKLDGCLFFLPWVLVGESMNLWRIPKGSRVFLMNRIDVFFYYFVIKSGRFDIGLHGVGVQRHRRVPAGH